MKKAATLLLLSFFLLHNETKSQCTSNQTYDLVVSGQTVLPPSPTSLYFNGYVCTGATLIDSMSCCTRFVHVEQGGTFIAGPMAYGTIYLKSGATFNGQNTSMTWMIYAETGSTVLNYSGSIISCVGVQFNSANCSVSVNEKEKAVVSVLHQQEELIFSFTELQQAVSIDIYDINGKLVVHEEAGTLLQYRLNLSALNNGLYFYRLYNGDALVKTDKISVLR